MSPVSIFFTLTILHTRRFELFDLDTYNYVWVKTRAKFSKTQNKLKYNLGMFLHRKLCLSFIIVFENKAPEL